MEYASHVANRRSGDHSGVNTGKNLKIWRREADGSLKIFRSIDMYECAPGCWRLITHLNIRSTLS